MYCICCLLFIVAHIIEDPNIRALRATTTIHSRRCWEKVPSILMSRSLKSVKNRVKCDLGGSGVTLGEKRRPQSGEKAPQSGQKAAQRGPKASQECLRGAQDRSKPPKRSPKVDLEVGNGGQSEQESIPRGFRELFFETKFKNT